MRHCSLVSKVYSDLHLLASAAFVTDQLSLWYGSLIVSIKAFSWLAWLVGKLFFIPNSLRALISIVSLPVGSYSATLLAFALQQNSRGNSAIWKTSVADFDFFAPATQIPPVQMQAHPNGQAQPMQFQPGQYAGAPHPYPTPQPMTHQYTGHSSIPPQHTGQASYPGAGQV